MSGNVNEKVLAEKLEKALGKDPGTLAVKQQFSFQSEGSTEEERGRKGSELLSNLSGRSFLLFVLQIGTASLAWVLKKPFPQRDGERVRDTEGFIFKWSTGLQKWSKNWFTDAAFSLVLESAGESGEGKILRVNPGPDSITRLLWFTISRSWKEEIRVEISKEKSGVEFGNEDLKQRYAGDSPLNNFKLRVFEVLDVPRIAIGTQWTKSALELKRQQLLNVKFPFPVNVIMIGPVGAGKSSLLNLLTSAIAKIRKRVAKTYASADHVTTDLNSYNLSTLLNPGVMMKIIDLVGWDLDVWRGTTMVKLFDLIATGKMAPPQKSLEPKMVQEFENYAPAEFKDKGHILLLVYPYHRIGCDNALKETSKEMIAAARERNIPVVVDVVRMDLAEKNVPGGERMHLQELWLTEEVRSKKKMLSEDLCVDEQAIFLTSACYSRRPDEVEGDVFHNYLALELLEGLFAEVEQLVPRLP